MDAGQADKVRIVLGILQDEHGFAGREIDAALLLPAEVKIDGGNLLYRTAGFLRVLSADKLDSTEKPNFKSKVNGALDEFVRLAFPSYVERHSSSDIAEFARRWGGLSICQHGLPYNHQPIGSLLIDPSSHFQRCAPSFVGEMFAESTKRWRELAVEAFDAMEIAARLRGGGDLRSDREELIQIANTWLSNGDVGVRLVDTAPAQRWPGGTELRLSAGIGLYGVLAAQLTMAVTLSRQLYVCAECGKLFTPEPSHRPRIGSRAFCLECGHPAAVRHAMRDLRQRRRQGETRELKETGIRRKPAAMSLQKRNDLQGRTDNDKKTRTK